MATGFKQATVNASDVPSTQSNYPAYVDLSRLGITTSSEAASVRCYSDASKTTELAREIVSTTEMWVKVPSLTSSFTLYVDWNDSSSDYADSATYGRNAVWSNYNIVHHFQETSANRTDSTGNGNTAVDQNTVTSAAGKLGGNAASFTRTNSEWFRITDGADVDLTVYSIQTWFKTSDGTNNLSLFSKRKNDTPGAGNGSPIDAFVLGGATDLLYLRNQSNTGLRQLTTSFSSLADNAWHNLTQVASEAGGTYTLTGYIDGSSIGSTSTPSDITCLNNEDLSIGARGTLTAASLFFSGDMDEFRVSPTALSANWITTEYNNQNDESGFWGTWSDVGGATPTRNAIFAFGGM